MSKWPEHKNPRPERAAKAPYNFVPLPDKVVTVEATDLPDQDRYDPGRHTGWIECTLTTASPLYVRAALEPEEFERSQEEGEEKRPWREQVRNKPDFFYTDRDHRPVIPGSSLRGMLRTMVEIAGYGKVQWVSDRQLVYRAVGDTTSHGEAYRDRLMRSDGEGQEGGKRFYLYTPLMRAGYLREKNGDWEIQPAREIDGTTFARISTRRIPDRLTPWDKERNCKNAAQIWVQTGRYDYQQVRGGFIRIKYARVLRASNTPEPGLERAALARSGWMPNKRSEAVIYEPDEAAKPIHIHEDLVRLYRDQITQIYRQQALSGEEKDSILGPRGVLVENQPVFYLVEGGKLVFFSHCMMFRLPYRQSPLDFVPEALRREIDTDLAEALFGYTKGTKDRQTREAWRDKVEPKVRAYAGRVFVSDATLAASRPADVRLDGERPVVPRILGGPKPTTFQHYLTQQHPNPLDTGQRTRDGRPKTHLALSDYASDTPGETVIRGHKGYWHKGEVGLDAIREKAPVHDHDTQHTQVRPVKPGVAFEFSIRFENLSDVELGALLWVLDKAGDEAYRLNLGMGKPYGMGAVKIESVLHLEDRPARYKALFEGAGWAAGEKADREAWPKARAAFERYVLDGVGERGPKRLDDLERIQMLLALLSWPGPPPEETRYLEIEHDDPQAKRGKVNEYKDRPVLPDATMLAGRPVHESRPRPKATQDLEPGYERGKVKAFGLGDKRSYGFIFPAGGGKEIFVHKSKLAPGVTTLETDQEVIFRRVRGMKGEEAHDVRPVE
ncbi:MAG: TIGR03986 family CRISPR-associated RAMP protein [Anaerolineae bacterium]|nr:TIGR03986 family CRISPR-associated RAMP protein [Anaerolineae bacterium]